MIERLFDSKARGLFVGDSISPLPKRGGAADRHRERFLLAMKDRQASGRIEPGEIERRLGAGCRATPGKRGIAWVLINSLVIREDFHRLALVLAGS
jgi:hypothetical protein